MSEAEALRAGIAYILGEYGSVPKRASKDEALDSILALLPPAPVPAGAGDARQSIWSEALHNEYDAALLARIMRLYAEWERAPAGKAALDAFRLVEDEAADSTVFHALLLFARDRIVSAAAPPSGGMTEGAQEDNTQNLAMLTRLFIYRAQKGLPLDDLCKRADEFLTRKGLRGSILREEDAASPAPASGTDEVDADEVLIGTTIERVRTRVDAAFDDGRTGPIGASAGLWRTILAALQAGERARAALAALREDGTP